MARVAKRGLRSEGTLATKDCIFQGPRRTRSQALRENQEIEIQHACKHKNENGYVCSPVKDARKTPSLTRDGSPDSAISSNSSKWSVSSNISIKSTLSVVAASESATILGSVVEEALEGSSESVNPDSINWRNDVATERTRAATPFIRTSAAANGSLVQSTASLVAESSNLAERQFLNTTKTADIHSGFTSELMVHLYIMAACASIASTKVELEKVSAVSHSLPLNPVVLQVTAWFVIGILYDLISPRTALLLPEVVVLLLHLINCSNFEKLYVHSHSYLSSIKIGLLGPHLAALHLGYRHNLAGVLSRVSLCYGLCGSLIPAAAKMLSLSLGNSINYHLLTLLSLLSIISAFSILGNSVPKVTGLLPMVSGHHSWTPLIGCLVMKVAVTVPASLLLPWLDALLRENSQNVSLAEVVTSGLLCTPAVIVPLLLLCTTLPTAIAAMGSLLVLFYLVMILVGVSDPLTLVLLIPLCGLMGVTQNLVLASLVTSSLHHPGLLLASNLALHTTSRYLTPLLIAQVMPVCTDSSTNTVFLTSWQSLNKAVKDKINIELLPAASYSMEAVACDDLHLHFLVGIGLVCSLVLLLSAKCVRI